MMQRHAQSKQAPESAMESGSIAALAIDLPELDGEALVRAYHILPNAATEDKAVRAFLPLVRHIINRIHISDSPSLNRDDLYHSGILGLLEALDRYDPAQNTSFKTYAYRRIQGEIIDAVREAGMLTRSQSKQVRILLDTEEALRANLGREPAHEEVQEKMGINSRDYDSIRMLIWQQQSISLDEEVSRDDADTVVRKELVVDENQLSPEEEFIAMGLKEELQHLIANLPERNRLILALYYYEELTLIDIGRVLGVSESRISQLLKETLGDLKDNLAPTR
ncbi:MAG: hypothetical protein COY19_05640 [Candidatus Marinimicrobia bacterium CG_4_10_14_0_2_um_filter_48_9]|nr:MAG: hypothetical protein COY19_05640 [Candidatus Marinimicrobia bacterium CG_4_10_14_0_2_um_filter_48_9]